MALSTLPLSYCTNVHAGQTVAEVLAGLDAYTVNVAAATGRPLAAGLWLAKPVVDELQKTPESLPAFAAALRDRKLSCHTLNAFPYGDFHSAQVKEKVYLPDWTTRNRLQYTQQCATVLAELLPDGEAGSISTLPLGFKLFDRKPGFEEAAIGRLIELVAFLKKLKDRTGKTVRLAIEPEPFCLLETTPEAISFFKKLFDAADKSKLGDAARDQLGLCFDVCHQAVEFEDVAASIGKIAAAGVRINKVHLSCAVQLDQPKDNAEGRAALKRYVEPRYLHQVMGGSAKVGRLGRAVDLTADLIDNAPEPLRSAETWRIHFHVPVDADTFGPLATTRPALRQALTAVAALDYAPHLEVETYTWQVLPPATDPAAELAGGETPAGHDLIAGLTRELNATHALLAEQPK